MTAETILLQRPRVTGRDHDRIVEIHEGEPLAMPVSVFGFCQIFRDEFMRQMAIHAAGNGMMRAMHPRCVLIVHDVAVLAGTRICGEVAESLPVVESISADTNQHPG